MAFLVVLGGAVVIALLLYPDDITVAYNPKDTSSTQGFVLTVGFVSASLIAWYVYVGVETASRDGRNVRDDQKWIWQHDKHCGYVYASTFYPGMAASDQELADMCTCEPAQPVRSWVRRPSGSA